MGNMKTTSFNEINNELHLTFCYYGPLSKQNWECMGQMKKDKDKK